LDGIWIWKPVTPMQTLTFYNAVANNGVIKPQFVSEIKEWNKTIVKNGKGSHQPNRYTNRNIAEIKSSFKKCG
jgi:cell division protein FtsI (penicillin-binding protein 3)